MSHGLVYAMGENPETFFALLAIALFLLRKVIIPLLFAILVALLLLGVLFLLGG